MSENKQAGIRQDSGTIPTEKQQPPKSPCFKPLSVEGLTPAEEAVNLCGFSPSWYAFTAYEVKQEYCRTHKGMRDDLLEFGILAAIYTAGHISGIRSERARKVQPT